VQAFVLGALEPDEESAFEARLAQDAGLQSEVSQYRAIVADLPLVAPPRRPPASIKARLLAEATQARPALASPQPLRRAPARPSRRFWLGGAFAAAALLIAYMGFSLFSLSNQLRAATSYNSELAAQRDEATRTLVDLRGQQEELQARFDALQQREATLAADLDASKAELADIRKEIAVNEQLVAFLSTADVATRSLNATDNADRARGAMYMRPGDPNAVVLISGLPALAPGDSYQFWLAQEGAPTQFNAGELLLNPDGSAQLVVHAPLAVNAFGEVMVTLEHEQNAPVPSDTRLLQGRL
jgi:anti-sigma-K factor RskA